MNGAPDWQDGECCFRCRAQFSLVARKHHCRNCGNIFCAKCSAQQIPLPKLNIEKNVRVCDSCYEKLSSKDDSLALVLDKSPEGSKSKSAKSSTDGSKSSASGARKSSVDSNRQASAPSEQDLKEEEELQLALALSLSEAPVKISFPDCKQLEDTNDSKAVATNNRAERQPTNPTNGHSASSSSTAKQTFTPTSSMAPTVATQPVVPLTTLDDNQVSNADKYAVHLFDSQPQSAPLSQNAPSQDHELFRFVAECQSAAEVFTNRVNSNKLRNRPIANDPAIQKQFLDLTTMQTKLLEYIKEHDVQRSGLETIQDKISQISDARAALDALREEHQEKMRQEAAEAERQRHSQLALKLEMMRQKKSEMMQYQRELALQRIQAQEMMLNQQQAYPPAPAPPTTSIPQHQIVSAPPTTMASAADPKLPGAPTQNNMQHPQPTIQHMSTQVSQQITQQPPMIYQQQTVATTPQYVPQIQLNQQQLLQQHQQATVPPTPKPEEEALLISFDD